jgi:hypothetical protein
MQPMSRLRSLQLLGWIACVSTAGCGGDDAGRTRETTALLTVEDFARIFSNLMCREARPCCESRGVKLVTTNCDLYEATLRDSIQGKIAANAAYDAAAASRCVDDVAAALTTCAAPDPLSCSGIVRGSLGLGAACEQAAECAPFENAATTCEEQASGMSRCVLGGSRDPDGVKASAGQVCTQSCSFSSGGAHTCFGTRFDPASVPRFAFSSGLRCGADGRCSALLPAGAPCGSFHGECELSLRCNAGTCAARAALGAKCSQSEECEDGAKCAASTCVATLARHNSPMTQRTRCA